MEVFSIITSSKKILVYFEEFIYNYSKLKLKYKDRDTAYFINSLTGENEIYYHYIPIEKEEYDYNYSDSEKLLIENYFKDDTIFIFDLQFKNDLFLNELLQDFKNYIKMNCSFSSDKNKIKVLYNGLEREILEW